MPVADKWYTIYEEIQLGTFGGNNTVVNAWESHDGGPFKQFHRASGIRWNNNMDNFFNRIRLETYMTEIAASAPTTAYIWYDEFMVSTKPIAAPGSAASVVPALPAPKKLRVVNSP